MLLDKFHMKNVVSSNRYWNMPWT